MQFPSVPFTRDHRPHAERPRHCARRRRDRLRRHHRRDRRARALDGDLAYWVADDHRKLRQALNGITARLASEGHLYSGAHGAARAEAKTKPPFTAAPGRASARVGWTLLARLGSSSTELRVRGHLLNRPESSQDQPLLSRTR